MTPPWFWTAWAFALGGFAAVAAVPQAVVTGFGHPALPALVHAFTVGAVLTGYFGLSFADAPATPVGAASWRARLRWGLPWAVWGLHVAGAALTLWGFWEPNAAAAYVGGHYLLPTAVVIVAVREALAAFRHREGAPREPWRLVPGLGLLVVMGLGVMLLLDRFYTQYGTYTPPTIALHGLAAAFLFVLPAQAARGWTSGAAPERAAVLARAGLGALGILALALAGHGLAYGWLAGLALLAAVALWTGLPEPSGLGDDLLPALRRAPWAVVGLLLGWAALRGLRGEDADGFALAGPIGTAIVLGAAVPDWLWRLTPGHATGLPPGGTRWFTLALPAALLVGLGQTLGREVWVQAGAFVGLVGLGALARPFMGAARDRGS